MVLKASNVTRYLWVSKEWEKRRQKILARIESEKKARARGARAAVKGPPNRFFGPGRRLLQ